LRPRQIERRDVARAWCEHAGRLLLRRTDAKAGRLAGLHELPETRDLGFQPSPEGIDGRPGRGDPRGLRPGNAGSGLPAPTGGKANSLVPAGNSLMATRRRTITRFQITESIHRVAPTVAVRQHIAKDPALAWVPLAGVDRLTLSGPHKRWIRELLEL
jgi:A/G-specific adenine glycosylase